LLFTVPLQATEGGVDANVERVAQSVEKVAETVSKSVSEAQLAGTELAFDRMEGYFTAAQGVIEKYGGDVAALGLNALRIDAISEVLPPLLLIIVFSILIFKVFLPTAIRKWNEGDMDDAADFFPWLTYAAPTISLSVCTLVNLTYLFNIWAWAGVFYPELWAIHKFILN
jgi:hypothetical protein